MLEFLIGNIFVSFGEILFQQVVGLPMGTNCAGEAGILLHIFGKFMILKLKSSRLSYIVVLIWPLSSSSRHKSKNDADEAVSVVSLISSSGGYINGRNSNYSDFLKRYLYLRNRLLEQGYKTILLIRSLLKSLYSDTKTLSQYIPSLQKRL
jgi:hypothetical protein